MGSPSDASVLADALIRLSSGAREVRLPRTFTNDVADAAASAFNAVADELERLNSHAHREEDRLNRALEDVSTVLVAVAAGDFTARAERNFQGDTADVLAYLVNNTAAEVGAFVTERERQAQQVIDAKEELRKQERLAVLGRLTATVSHDLRNPLATVTTTLHQLKVAIQPASPTLQKLIDRIERNTARCDRLVAELLDFTQTTTFSPASVELDAWLCEVAAEMRPPPGVELVLELQCPGQHLELDRDRLRRALINLVDNAIEAIAGMQVPPTGRVTLFSRLHEGALEIAVADTGPGIPVELREKVFEPLFSTKSFGIGLGLTIVRNTAELHHGRIFVEDAPGGGGRVGLRLPIPAP